MMVFRAKPVARATDVTPPQPKSSASLAAHCRRIRSSISPDNDLYLFRIRLMMALSCVKACSPTLPPQATLICSCYCCAVPNEVDGVLFFEAENFSTNISPRSAHEWD